MQGNTSTVLLSFTRLFFQSFLIRHLPACVRFNVTAIENLQQHENEAIYEKSISLIEQYFGCDDEVEDENLAPAVNGNTFSFGVPQKSLGGTFDAVAPEGDFQQPMAQFNFAS